jgi:hypothetical protein
MTEALWPDAGGPSSAGSIRVCRVISVFLKRPSPSAVPPHPEAGS